MKKIRKAMRCLGALSLMVMMLSACTRQGMVNSGGASRYTKDEFAVYIGTNYEDLPDDLDCDIYKVYVADSLSY